MNTALVANRVKLQVTRWRSLIQKSVPEGTSHNICLCCLHAINCAENETVWEASKLYTVMDVSK